MATFEIGVFNQGVRDALKQGKRHRDLTDDWADVHYLDVEADDATAARTKIARRYPAERGYVIASVEAHKY